jgi:hypothetical protein
MYVVMSLFLSHTLLQLHGTTLLLRVEFLAALFHPLVMTTAETAGTMPTAVEDLHLLATTLLMRAATIIVP